MTAIDDRPVGDVGFSSVDELLADARSRLERLAPQQAAQAVANGARFVDIRPSWQRAQEGEIPGSLIVERNHLEWRLHPRSAARLPQADPTQRWIVVCSEGYTSSLAADALRSLGVPATDLIGGVHGWNKAGYSLTPGPTPVQRIVGEAALVDLREPGAAHVENKPTH
jgi:rhodanese-related sulfurtransferase